MEPEDGHVEVIGESTSNDLTMLVENSLIDILSNEVKLGLRGRCNPSLLTLIHECRWMSTGY